MFCGQCGEKNSDDARFCNKCGASLINVQTVSNSNDESDNIENTVNQQASNVIPTQPIQQPVQDTVSEPKKKSALPIAIVGIVGIVAVIAIVVTVSTLSSIKKSNETLKKIEDNTLMLCVDVSANAEDIVSLYEEYNNLPDDKKRKITNREKLIESYNAAVNVINERKSKAEQVDALINSVDTSNIFAEASTIKPAISAFKTLDEYELKYLNGEETLRSYYNEVKDMNVAVTPENFYQLFSVSFSVAEKVNYGNTTYEEDGSYTIDENKITPNYDFSAQNDYSIPVYIYVKTKYPNLYSNCNFYINLHQTYNGLGIIDSDVHEFALQSATLSYDSSMGTGEYLINVEDNDATDSLLSFFGWSFDWSDLFHSMNDFDASLVEISDISGSVTY